MTTAQLFKALGDPTRLHIIEKLVADKAMTLSNLSEDVAISRQGVRKQIKVLESAGLVRLLPAGREVQVVLDMSKLEQGKAFIAKLEAAWDKRLLRLKQISEKR